MDKIFYSILVLGVISIFLSSCSTYHKTMRAPNVIIKLNKADFTLSNQVSAKAETSIIYGIDADWLYTFTKKTGTLEKENSVSISFANIPVIGDVISDKTANYALYELMKNNPGYDVVFFPQYAKKVTSIAPWPFKMLFKVTNVEVTAKLGKLNE